MDADDTQLPSVCHDTSLGQAFARRRTERAFATTSLSPDHLAGVLSGARHDDTGWAYPSAHDRRPVELSVLVREDAGGVRRSYAFDPTTNRLRLRQSPVQHPLSTVAHDAQPWLDTAPVVLALEADLSPLAAEFAAQDPSGLRGRDFVMIEAGSLAQNLLLGAAISGLGAVLVAGLRQEECRELLSTSRHVCSLIALGHPEEGTARRTRPTAPR